MPPQDEGGAPLDAGSVAKLRQWIESGAPWPERDAYWAFQPPVATAPPGVGTNEAARNPVDRFVLSRLEAEGIAPNPEADPRTLLRRAFADLIGMPPSPEETARFLADPSPDAFERLVDRLLADPRYGERWARHWLDLVRYGESDGYEDDKVRPHAWRYRDYVVRSLNSGKPFDRFVEEQVAGDELWPEDADAWIATGFSRLGAWDGMSKEPEVRRQDFLNDATDAIGSAVLGVTLGCARCHDHKYDDIRQKDYYRVQAFFAGVSREHRDLPTNGPFWESPAVTGRHQTGSATLRELNAGRERLLREARAVLETETCASPVEDDAVRKRVEQLHPGRLDQLQQAIKSEEARLRLVAPVAEVVARGDGARGVPLLRGGELSRPGEIVAPGFPEAIGALGIEFERSSRTALARWLTHPEHPLTARVLVNRLWQHHFGRGLVGTPSDFGRNGRQPSHPELLDWLARELVGRGYRVKDMHRLLMTSATYRRSGAATPTAMALDPVNRWWWRMDRRRLEAEAVRDTLLSVSGTLDRAMEGPGLYARLPEGVNVEFPNNDKELSWGDSSPADDHRRSLYLFQRRSLTYPLMDVFDAAPMNQSCAVRARTTVAPQALALFNGEFARSTAAEFARRLLREAGGDPGDQISLAFRLAFQRVPSASERAAALAFLREQSVVRHGSPDPASAALTDFCHVLWNANELIYVD